VCNVLDVESDADSLVYTASLLTIQVCKCNESCFCMHVCKVLGLGSDAHSLVYVASLLTIQVCVLYVTHQSGACVK